MPTARITMIDDDTFVAQIEVSGRTIEVPVDAEYAYGFDPDEDADLLANLSIDAEMEARITSAGSPGSFSLWEDAMSHLTGDDEWAAR